MTSTKFPIRDAVVAARSPGRRCAFGPISTSSPIRLDSITQCGLQVARRSPMRVAPCDHARPARSRCRAPISTSASIQVGAGSTNVTPAAIRRFSVRLAQHGAPPRELGARVHAERLVGVGERAAPRRAGRRATRELDDVGQVELALRVAVADAAPGASRAARRRAGRRRCCARWIASSSGVASVCLDDARDAAGRRRARRCPGTSTGAESSTRSAPGLAPCAAPARAASRRAAAACRRRGPARRRRSRAERLAASCTAWPVPRCSALDHELGAAREGRLAPARRRARPRRAGASAASACRARAGSASIGRPPSSWSTLARRDFIRVPLPAARISAASSRGPPCCTPVFGIGRQPELTQPSRCGRARLKGSLGRCGAVLRRPIVEAPGATLDLCSRTRFARALHRAPREPGAGPSAIFGNTHGLKASQVRQLERLLGRRLPPDRLVTHEFARELTELTARDPAPGRRAGRPARRGDPRDGRRRARHRAAGLGPHARRPRPAARPALHPHAPRRRAADQRRPDRPRAAAARRDGRDRHDDEGLPGLAHVAALRPTSDAGAASSTSRRSPPAQLDLDFLDWIRALEEELARAATARARSARASARSWSSVTARPAGPTTRGALDGARASWRARPASRSSTSSCSTARRSTRAR